jgi:regulator of sirC expression with transglutaminase-like and TPR domain
VGGADENDGTDGNGEAGESHSPKGEGHGTEGEGRSPGGEGRAPDGKGQGSGEPPSGNRRRFAEAAREERPDLALLCLLIGAEAEEEAGREGRRGGGGQGAADALVDGAQAELDRLTGQLPYERGRSPEQWVRALERLLGQEHGFAGAPADYRRLDSSLLHSVLRRRRGLPIMLSVVWLEVARRAGAPVYGVALPGHFVVGFGDPSGHFVLADPFNGGKPLSPEETEMLVAGATGGRAHISDAALQPAGVLETVLRILNNIRAWASDRPEQSGVRLWAVELSLLLPHHPGRLRLERAQLLVARGDFVAGAREMEEYADVVATMEPNAAEDIRRGARAARARLN